MARLHFSFLPKTGNRRVWIPTSVVLYVRHSCRWQSRRKFSLEEYALKSGANFLWLQETMFHARNFLCAWCFSAAEPMPVAGYQLVHEIPDHCRNNPEYDHCFPWIRQVWCYFQHCFRRFIDFVALQQQNGTAYIAFNFYNWREAQTCCWPEGGKVEVLRWIMLYNEPHPIAAKQAFSIVKHDRLPVSRVAVIIHWNAYFRLQNKFCFEHNISLNLFVQ